MDLSLKNIVYLLLVFLIAQSFITTGLVTTFDGEPGAESRKPEAETEEPGAESREPATRGSSRATTLDFTANSSGLPSTGSYNYIAFGDFNKDGDIDFATGGEDRPSSKKTGLYAYAGNGGTSWTSTSTGLWTGNSWGGVWLADADEDGDMELYGTDEHWGSYNSSGLKAFEYRSSSWTDSTTYVSTPLSSGLPDNVVVTNVTGNDNLDIVVSNGTSGLAYFENTGGNPVTWKSRSNGLGTSSEYTAIAVADINQDGLKDIAANDYSGGEHIFVQKTSGSLWGDYSSGVSISQNQLGVTLGDMNNDNHMDIIYGGQSNGLRVYLGNSGGGSGGTSFSWTSANSGLPTNGQWDQIQVGDIDLDGDLDIVGPDASGSYGIAIYLGNGSENPGNNLGFQKATTKNLTTSGTWYGCNLYDINGDGSLDIVGASWGSGIRCWLSKLKGNVDKTPPGQITDLAVVETTTGSIKVNWTAPAQNGTDSGSGPVSSYDIRYSTSDINPGNWASANQVSGEPAPTAPGTNQEYNITGLNSATQYFIAIRSYDARPLTSPLSNILINSTFGFIDLLRPGQITDLVAKNPTNDTIEITWTAPADNGTDIGSGAATAYEIRYHSVDITNGTWSAASVFATPPTPGTPGSTELANITGLTPVKKYYFAVKARDERPNWNYISNSAFNTTLPNPDLTPPNAITDLSVASVTKDSMNITWTAPGDDGTSGNATTYDIRYGTAMINAGNWASATLVSSPPAPMSQGSTEYFNVTSLNAETMYYFAIKSADERPNWSPLSNVASDTTDSLFDQVAPSTITDLAADQPSDSSIRLTWTAPGEDGPSGTVSGYDIRYATATINDGNWASATQASGAPTPVSAGNNQEYTVTGLLSDTTYYFGIKSFDERPNYSPLSNIVSETTLASTDTTAPDAIDDLAADAISSNSINLTWTAPGDDGATGIAATYDIRYSTVSITDLNWDSASTVSNEPSPRSGGSPESFIVSGLFADTTYYFAISTSDEKPNWSPLSNIASATTLTSADTTPPAKITDLDVTATTEDSATLTWTAVGDDGLSGTATAYEIGYADAAVTAQTWNFAQKVSEPPLPKPASETETFTISGLDPDSTYFFAVRAADEVPNWSPVSNSPSGKTLGVALPEFIVTLTPELTTLYSNETMEITVEVLAKIGLSPINQADITFSSDTPGTAFDPVSDQSDTTGSFTASVTAPEVSDPTFITVFADATKTSFSSNRSWVTITVMPVPAETKFNLKITPDDITFSNDTMKADEEITIYAKIYNFGTRDASKFTVKFFIDDAQVGSDISFNRLNRDKFVIAEVDWTAAVGAHTVKVEVAPEQSDLESNSADNSAEKPITVLTKEGDEPKPEPDKKGDEKESAISPMSLGLIIIVVIIVVILIVVMLMRKKKQPEQQVLPPQYPAPPEQAAYQYKYPPAMPAPPADEALPAGVAIAQEPAGETAAEVPPAMEAPAETPALPPTEEVPPAAEEPGAEGQPSLTEGQQPEAGEPPVTEPPVQEPVLDVAGTTKSVDSAEQQPPAESQPPMAESREPEAGSQGQQMVACPICANQIAVYATPCPHCNTALNW